MENSSDDLEVGRIGVECAGCCDVESVGVDTVGDVVVEDAAAGGGVYEMMGWSAGGEEGETNDESCAVTEYTGERGGDAVDDATVWLELEDEG